MRKMARTKQSHHEMLVLRDNKQLSVRATQAKPKARENESFIEFLSMSFDPFHTAFMQLIDIKFRIFNVLSID